MSYVSDLPDNGSDGSPAQQRARLTASLIEISGVFLTMVALIWAGLSSYRMGQLGAVDVDRVLAVLALLAAAVSACMLLWGQAALLRSVSEGPARSDASPAASGEPARALRAPSAAPAPAADPARLDAILLALRELRDVTLLTDEQRAARVDAAGRTLAGELEGVVPALLREHRWREARQRVQEARTRFPGFPQFERLERQIEAARAQVEEHDVAQVERQINDLSALGALDRAADLVRELLERHPDSQRARALAATVRQKYDASQSETRSRLMAQAQDATRARDWQTAMQVAQTIVQNFPRSSEAEALRLQMPTLQANFEIQTRQRMEQQIRECVRERRFDEALGVASQLIDRYPSSPQAEALRAQLPKLQQMAALAGPQY